LHIQASSDKQKAMKQLQVSKEVCYPESDFLFLHNQQDLEMCAKGFFEEYRD